MAPWKRTELVAVARLSSLLLVSSLALGCTREDEKRPSRVLPRGDASKVVLNQTPRPESEAKGPAAAKPHPKVESLATVVPTPAAALEAEASAPEAASAGEARILVDSAKPLPDAWWSGPGPVRASAAHGGRVVLAPVDLRGAQPAGSLVEVTQGGATTLLTGLARIDGVDASDSGVCFIEFPNGGTSGITVKRRGADGEVQTLLERFDGGHRIENCEGPVFWIAPVRAQGKRGGIGRFDPAAKTRTEHLAELGPAFSLITAGARVYFMAHKRGGLDVVYSMDTAAEDVRAHVKMPRGLLAMAVDDRTIYWARLGGDGRSTEFGAVPVDGSTPPRSLGRVEGTVFDGLAVGDGELIVSTSAAQQPGIVARLPLKGGDVTAFKSVDRVWQLLSDSKGVYVHHEFAGEEGPERAVTRVVSRG